MCRWARGGHFRGLSSARTCGSVVRSLRLRRGLSLGTMANHPTEDPSHSYYLANWMCILKGKASNGLVPFIHFQDVSY